MLLCVGDFFSNDEKFMSNWLLYRNGTKKAPIATYILGPNQQDHAVHYEIGSEDGFDFCDNITYLGQYFSVDCCEL